MCIFCKECEGWQSFVNKELLEINNKLSTNLANPINQIDNFNTSSEDEEVVSIIFSFSPTPVPIRDVKF
jgi:hypothetical protein